MLNYETLVLGELATNCYLVWDEKTKVGVVVDPADSGELIAEEVDRRGIEIKFVLATHGHFDHVLAALYLKLVFEVPFGCSLRDEFLLKRQAETAKYFLGHEIEVPNIVGIDLDLDRTEVIDLGSYKMTVIKTPGHTPGGVSLLAEDLLFCGDTLFEDGVGRTDLSYSDSQELEESVAKLRGYVDGGAILLPGHGEIQLFRRSS